MARKARVEYAGATYHLMCRGNHQEPIFKDNRDCEIFLDTLGDVIGRMGWKLHAFVLMGNHYHLLTETPEPNLVDGMRWFQGTYTQRFNSRHKVWGHLFQSRYKALPVDEGDYFSTVADYIHLNPARARCLDVDHGRLVDYKWSSFCGYARTSVRPDFLTVDRVLEGRGFTDDTSGRRRYGNYMKRRVLDIQCSGSPMEAEEQWKAIRRGWAFGGDEFREKISTLADGVMKGKDTASYSGGSRKMHDARRAEELLKRGLDVFGMKEDDLSLLRKGDVRKKVIAWIIRKNTGVKNEWISERMYMGHPNSVSRHVGEVESSRRGELFELKQGMLECEA
jgi:putative transposase